MIVQRCLNQTCPRRFECQRAFYTTTGGAFWESSAIFDWRYDESGGVQCEFFLTLGENDLGIRYEIKEYELG